MVVLHQADYLEAFVGNEIARFHQRTRSLASEVFTVPLHLERALCQSFNGLLAVLRPLLFAGDAPMQAFELRCCLAETSVDCLY